MNSNQNIIMLGEIKNLILNLDLPAFIEDEKGILLFINNKFIGTFGANSIEKEKLTEICKKQTLSLRKINPNDYEREIAYYEFVGQDLVKQKFRDICLGSFNSDDGTKIFLHILLNETNILSELKFLTKEKLLFDLLHENTEDIVFFKNNKGEYLFVNKAFCEKNNISREKIIGKTDKELYGIYKAQDIINEEKEIIGTKTKLINKVEKTVQQKGKTSWISTSKIPLMSDDGNVLGLLGIAKDITGLKKIEEENEYILKFQKLISQISAVFLKNTYSNFRNSLVIVLREISNFFNANYSSIFQLNEKNNQFEKVIDYPSTTRISTLSNILDYKSWLTKLEKGEHVYQTIEEVKENTNEHDYFISNKIEKIFLIPLFNYSAFTGFILLHLNSKSNTWAKDYPDLLRILSEIISNSFSNNEAEKYRLEAEEEMLKLLRAVNQSTDAIIILDQDFKIEYANNIYSEMTGIYFEELLGRKPFFLSDNINIHWNTSEVMQSLRNGNPHQAIFQDKKKDGESYWGKISVSPIKNFKGEITNYLAMIEDITEKMIADSRREVSQKLESIGQLAAGIAHEINTPMQYINDNSKFIASSINSFKQFLEELNNQISKNENASPKLFEKIKQLKENYDIDYLLNEMPEAIKQSEEGIKRVTTIIKAMKDFAHPGNKQMAFADLNRGIEVTATISKNEWKYYADLRLELDPTLPLVYCLIDELNQVILNMIINATHAIQEKYKDSNEKLGLIIISTSQDEKDVIIKVSDNGSGISPTIINKIFDPFFTTKEVGKGTGQGLAIAHDIIVNKHKGYINVTSELGKGTTFIIKIPKEKNGNK